MVRLGYPRPSFYLCRTHEENEKRKRKEKRERRKTEKKASKKYI